MLRDQFELALAAAIQGYPDGAHEGWKADFASFDQIRGLESIRVRMTGERNAMIEARGQARSAEISALEVSQELVRIWVEVMVFRSEYEAHFVTVTAESVVLEAFTINGKHCVTARVIIDMQDASEA